MTSEQQALDDLHFYFNFDSDSSGEVPLESVSGSVQTTFDDISSGKNIVGKLYEQIEARVRPVPIRRRKTTTSGSADKQT